MHEWNSWLNVQEKWKVSWRTQELDLFNGTKSNAIAYMVLNFLSISNADYLLIPEPDALKLSKQITVYEEQIQSTVYQVMPSMH